MVETTVENRRKFAVTAELAGLAFIGMSALFILDETSSQIGGSESFSELITNIDHASFYGMGLSISGAVLSLAACQKLQREDS